MDSQDWQAAQVKSLAMGSGIGGYAGNSVAPKEAANSRIRDGVTYLEGQLGELHSLLTALEGRLDTVMTSVPPQPAVTSAAKDPQFGSHLYDRLHTLSMDVAGAQERVRQFLQRIEV